MSYFCHDCDAIIEEDEGDLCPTCANARKRAEKVEHTKAGSWMLWLLRLWCRWFGHHWVEEGARQCPREAVRCSQSVFVCQRCGTYDYGERGGPAWKLCRKCWWGSSPCAADKGLEHHG